MAKNRVISFQLSEEWVNLLAKSYGYQSKLKVQALNEDGSRGEEKEVDNKQLPEDYIEDILIKRLTAEVTELTFHAMHAEASEKVAKQLEENPGITKAKKK